MLSSAVHAICFETFCACLPGWKPGDPIPGSDLAGKLRRDQPTEPKEEREQQPKALVPPSSNTAFDFVLNPDWEAVEEDFSEDESD